jgi:exodeoxyribonuclease VII small subunit
MARRKKTFEDALVELESIAEQIEAGAIGLEESIKKYQDGMRLIGQCRSILDSAEKRIQQLELEEKGVKTLDDFEESCEPGQDDQ